MTSSEWGGGGCMPTYDTFMTDDVGGGHTGLRYAPSARWDQNHKKLPEYDGSWWSGIPNTLPFNFCWNSTPFLGVKTPLGLANVTYIYIHQKVSK